MNLDIDGARAPAAIVARREPSPSAQVRLVTFGHAGSGPSAFRRWARSLAPEIELWEVTLPGRAGRLREPFAARWEPLVEELAGAIAAEAPEPFALFGHSFGAVLAFEVARRLSTDGVRPVGLIVSGRSAPQCVRRLELPSDDATLVRVLSETYGGVPAEVAREPELLRHFLPPLRADLALLGRYEFERRPPLGCPITVLSGREDATVDPAELDGWSEHTTERCDVQLFSGDHFYFQPEQEAVVAAIKKGLSEMILTSSAPTEAPKLSIENTVPRAFAHRVAVGEVFVTDSAAIEDHFVVAVQLPRAHSVWFDRLAAYHDPLSTVEAARQAVFVALHRHLEVPVGLPFTLQSFAVHITSLAAYVDDCRTPLEGVLTMHMRDDRRSDELGTITVSGEMEIAGKRALSLDGTVVFMPKEDYLALRRFQRARKPEAAAFTDARRLAPAAVGRRDERNVVIGSGAVDAARRHGRFPLLVDQDHPSFFDHSYDHAPGPLILEAFRQAAIVTGCDSRVLETPVVACTGAEAAFTAFGELDAPLEVTATLDRHGERGASASVTLEQFGSVITTGRIDLGELPR
jgi:surfactin synthase thioesterase subunit